MPRRLLDLIDAPTDLKTLTHDELAQVAQEARDTIISVITERGGHLASNLGVVELTLALHRVFDSPTDSLVWDTTNQTYTHKLVTGRRDEFQKHPPGGRPVRVRRAKRKPARHTLRGPRGHRTFNRSRHRRRRRESPDGTRGPSRWSGTER